MKAIYDIPAPAKLNLFLHINGRRADGYHLLQSVFMLIDWADTLHVELRHDGQLSREDLSESLPPDDLVLRAARALQTHSGCALGAHIGVFKRVPAQAGMGGGSSDAASCLLALNRLWGLNLPLNTLETLGLRLGADVPFFLRGQNAWVEGIGERITPLVGNASLFPRQFAVVKPASGLDTAKIFLASDLKRSTETATIVGFAAVPKYSFGCNDLQPVAERLCPEVTSALCWLSNQGLHGRMTGSGSAVFAPLMETSEPASWDALPEGMKMRICCNLEAHPLLGWASGV